MRVKCIIVDDEPLAIEVIKSHLSKLESFEIVAACNNAMEAFQIINQQRVDLIFLDIQMPGMKGTDFLKNLINPPKVILTTAYREYALEGYELDVVDYLLKPISNERFIKAISKFLQTINSGTANQQSQAESLHEKYVYINVNKKVHKILLDDILYAESIKDYISINTISGKIVAKSTITAFESLLPPNDFMRIHRSFIVSLNKIKSFSAHAIEVGKTELPIGRNYQPQVFSKLKYTHL